MDSPDGAPSPPSTAPPRPPPFPGREDCWTEEATSTLVDAWGERYLELNKGNLRQKHWQEVADAVNANHGHVKKARRTDVQCKNRIDTLKKKYKIEKNKAVDFKGNYTSPWPFFSRLDALIGDAFPIKKPSPAPPIDRPRRGSPPSKHLRWIMPHVPVAPRSVTQKRPALPSPVTASLRNSSSRQRNFSAIAAAAEAESEDSAESRSRSGSGSRSRKRGREGEEKSKESECVYLRELAQAIERFGEVYERVETAKQRQMVELEKQRMQFAKDLEFQRMELFMETQVQLQKINNSAKRSSSQADSF